MIQSGGFLGKLLGPLLKTGLPLIKNVIEPLAKSDLIPLGLAAAISAADAGIHKKILGTGNTTLIISNDENSKISWRFWLLGNLLTESGVNRTGKDRGINRAGESALATRQGRGVLRAGYGSRSSKMDF